MDFVSDTCKSVRELAPVGNWLVEVSDRANLCTGGPRVAV